MRRLPAVVSLTAYKISAVYKLQRNFILKLVILA